MHTQEEAIQIIWQAVQEICLSFPGVTAFETHGHTGFKTSKRMFAWYVVNHHGDNRMGLQVFAGYEMQQSCLEEASAAGKEIFYLPAYTGGKGWLGMELNRGLPWSRVYELTRLAWQRSAPAKLTDPPPAPPLLDWPLIDQPLQLDPMLLPDNAAMLSRIRRIALALPEVTEDRQFGSPSFRAGKKTFCTLHAHGGRLGLQTWAGEQDQGLLTLDDRYRIPAYIGHNGWIELDLTEGAEDAEMESLMLASYRHFALKRMLKQLA